MKPTTNSSDAAINHGFGATPVDAVLRCDGSRDCTALTHIHGCFADKGKCDRPEEHRVRP